MITNKQRSYLRKLANELDSSFQVGKDGIGGETIRHLDNMLRTRELVKVTVLKTSPDSVRDTADNLAGALDAAVVQTIGHKFVLYRHSEDLAKEGKALRLPKK